MNNFENETYDEYLRNLFNTYPTFFIALIITSLVGLFLYNFIENCNDLYNLNLECKLYKDSITEMVFELEKKNKIIKTLQERNNIIYESIFDYLYAKKTHNYNLRDRKYRSYKE
jgi:hypothetical protein